MLTFWRVVARMPWVITQNTERTQESVLGKMATPCETY